ncbi:hypothetical protein ACFXKY_03245 [Streptomyces canus]|uniref:hypothetical protein n=1 Tax=Streptomyces canus TaxID=58343 RepID=UPI003676E768
MAPHPPIGAPTRACTRRAPHAPADAGTRPRDTPPAHPHSTEDMHPQGTAPCGSASRPHANAGTLQRLTRPHADAGKPRPGQHPSGRPAPAYAHWDKTPVC